MNGMDTAVVDQQSVLKSMFNAENTKENEPAVDQQDVPKELSKASEPIENEPNSVDEAAALEKERKEAEKLEAARLKELMHAKKLEERREKAAIINAEKEKINEEHNKKVEEARIRRLEYLEKQTKIFSHFVHDDNNNNNGPEVPNRNRKSKSKDDNGPFQFQESPAFIQGTLRHYQLDGLNWLIKLQHHGLNSILADEMGLGKTLQTISLLAYMTLQKKMTQPHLVVVPLSTLNNWMNEFNRWCPKLRVLKYHDSDKYARQYLTQKLKKTRIDYDVILTTYQVAIIEKTAITRIRFSFVVVDEAHILKNEHTNLPSVVRNVHKTNIVLLTGTPLHNTTHELWALLNLLQPDFFNSSSDFDNWFEDDKCCENDVLAQKLKDILKPFMLRRIKADVEKSIPPKKYYNIYLPITSLQKRYIRKILDKDVSYMSGAGLKKMAITNSFAHLRKVSNHPYLIEGCEHEVTGQLQAPCGDHIVKNSSKMVALDKLLKRFKDQGSRVLLFCQQVIMLDILDDYFHWKGYNYRRLTGITSGDERQQFMDEFNSPDSDIFIFMITTRAGGVGINLTAADVVIFYDMDWNPQMDIQAEDRAHRIGQTKQVRIYRLMVKDTIDVSIFNIAEKKKKLDTVIIQRSLSKDEMAKIIQFQTSAIDDAQVSEEVISDKEIDMLVQMYDDDDNKENEYNFQKPTAQIESVKKRANETNEDIRPIKRARRI